MNACFNVNKSGDRREVGDFCMGIAQNMPKVTDGAFSMNLRADIANLTYVLSSPQGCNRP